jgi:hypothetical protein
VGGGGGGEGLRGALRRAGRQEEKRGADDDGCLLLKEDVMGSRGEGGGVRSRTRGGREWGGISDSTWRRQAADRRLEPAGAHGTDRRVARVCPR